MIITSPVTISNASRNAPPYPLPFCNTNLSDGRNSAFASSAVLSVECPSTMTISSTTSRGTSLRVAPIQPCSFRVGIMREIFIPFIDFYNAPLLPRLQYLYLRLLICLMTAATILFPPLFPKLGNFYQHIGHSKFSAYGLRDTHGANQLHASSEMPRVYPGRQQKYR